MTTSTTNQPFSIASTVDEALTAIAAGARPIAGGTDLVVGARQGKAPLPPALVAIDRIPALNGIGRDREGVSIGAAVTHAQLMTDPVIVSDYTALADAAALVGSPATRNVGTLGGNVMNGSPAMDTGAPLMALGATVELRSASTSRIVAPSDLWVQPGVTSAEPEELCVACLLPARPQNSGSAYVRLEYRRAMEIAVVGAAANVQLGPEGELAAISVALAAVAPTIVGVEGLDAYIGNQLTDDTLAALGTAAAERAVPISDLRASAEYRSHCVGVMTKRAITAAAQRAAGESVAVPVNRSQGVGRKVDQ